jgi:hypothetical protein
MSDLRYQRALQRINHDCYPDDESGRKMYEHDRKIVDGEDNSLSTRPCECEHICHFEKDKRSPNGNPGHNYGIKFVERKMQEVKSTLGLHSTFYCMDCANDCMVNYIDKS